MYSNNMRHFDMKYIHNVTSIEVCVPVFCIASTIQWTNEASD